MESFLENVPMFLRQKSMLGAIPLWVYLSFSLSLFPFIYSGLFFLLLIKICVWVKLLAIWMLDNCPDTNVYRTIKIMREKGREEWKKNETLCTLQQCIHIVFILHHFFLSFFCFLIFSLFFNILIILIIIIIFCPSIGYFFLFSVYKFKPNVRKWKDNDWK